MQRLEEANALYLVVQEFAKLDLRAQHVSNTEMGSVFEELIRKFAEASNETAGEHLTPREVIALANIDRFAANLSMHRAERRAPCSGCHESARARRNRSTRRGGLSARRPSSGEDSRTGFAGPLLLVHGTSSHCFAQGWASDTVRVAATWLIMPRGRGSAPVR